VGQATGQAIGKILRKARVNAGKQQEDAAQALGVSRVAVSNYERGLLPADFDEKLEKLASLYGTTSAFLRSAAQSDIISTLPSGSIPEREPIERHISKFPVPVQRFFFVFIEALLGLSEAGEISGAAIERARTEITFAQLDLWAGGELESSQTERTLDALRWSCIAAWRSVTDPGWLGRAQTSWKPLPGFFERTSGNEGASIKKKHR
jgi:transcriptional regulator with XRE-family HTH domain